MLLRFVLVGLIGISSPLSAAPLHLDFLKIGSHTYTNVTVMGANTSDLYFTHDAGMSNVKLRYVDARVQKLFNYDPAKAAEAELQQEKDDFQFRTGISSNLVAQAQKSIRAARNAANTSPASLADPISDNSPLGKPAPPFTVEKWLANKPNLQGKSLLIAFWSSWSIPCRKIIPDLNAFQKAFADRLLVIGITSEAETDLQPMDVSLDFPSAIDTQAKLLTAFDVTSVPSCVLIDSTGVVRYFGHPAALDIRKLQLLLAPPSQ
jgi:thiol-disulfide isomerase/thioredoxin